MKKILSFLGALGLLTSTVTSTISCDVFAKKHNGNKSDYRLENALYDDDGNIKLNENQVKKLFEVHF